MDQGDDPVLQATARLEAAVEALATVLRHCPPAGADAGVPRAEVAALAARLDDGLLRLRAALADAQGTADTAEG